MTKNGPDYTSFLPDFCGTRIVFIVVLLAELLAIVLTLAHIQQMNEILFDLALNSLFILWVALSCVATLCLCRPFLNHLSDVWVASLSYLITLLVSVIVTELAWWVMNQSQNDFYGNSGHGLFLIRIMGICAIVNALSLRYFYIQHQWRLRTKSESEARFQALQSRIRPHFLFNSMNTIASLIPRQPGQAEQAIEDLADLFRASLQDVQAHISLKEEIELCEHYLRLEKLRLGGRLNVEWQIEGLDTDRMVPPLTLQPLVENGIIHGIECLPEGGTLLITGEMQRSTLHITVQNPLPAKPQAPRDEGHHLAQENIRQRLFALYDQTDLLKVEEDGQEYRVRITIPYTDENTDR